MSGAAAGKKGGRRDMDNLSQVYFSSPAAEAAEPSALVPVRNGAGPEGDDFLGRLCSTLRKRGLSAISVSEEGGKFRLDNQKKLVTHKQFVRKLEEEIDTSFLFLRFDKDDSPLAGKIMGNGDTALLLFSGEVHSLKGAYLFLKELERARCGLDPVLLPVGDAADPWMRIAPLRLAEAAAKFLNRKLSIWVDEEKAASHLEGLLNGIARRREKGTHLIARKLETLLGGVE